MFLAGDQNVNLGMEIARQRNFGREVAIDVAEKY